MIDVVAAVIEEDGRFLACRRRAGRAEGGLWEFPGGKVEPGESPDEALVREIREELDVSISASGHFTTVEKGNLRLLFMRAHLTGPRPSASSDHDRLKWLTLDQLLTLTWAPADLVAVEQLTAAGGLDDLESAIPADDQSDA